MLHLLLKITCRHGRSAEDTSRDPFARKVQGSLSMQPSSNQAENTTTHTAESFTRSFELCDGDNGEYKFASEVDSESNSGSGLESEDDGDF